MWLPVKWIIDYLALEFMLVVAAVLVLIWLLARLVKRIGRRRPGKLD